MTTQYTISDAIEKLKALNVDTPTKPKLPNDELISSYENELGMKFSKDYKKFLQEASDVFVGYLNPLIITEDRNAHGELLTAVTEARCLGVPNDWLPICEDNGDYYCLTEKGVVRFWSHDGLSDEFWPSLASWIQKVWIGQQ